MNGIVLDQSAEVINASNTGSTEWAQSRMDGTQDLIDERQVALFDVFDQLSRLGGTERLEPPQLVVVGDQSCGKSSVLEAIGRFHFPVHAGLCTRFPTKLIMRRAVTERTELSIEPGKSRSDADRTRLLQFHERLSSSDGFAELMIKASRELGVLPSPTGGGVSGGFTDDVLVVKKQGPNLPLVNLIDLPGIFRVASNEQGEEGRETVEMLAKEHVKNKRNLVLLVVNAGGSLHGQLAPGFIQDIAKSDPGLAGRVIGVITNPDRVQFHEEYVRILNGSLTSSGLKILRWHVVKNQDKDKRAETLEQRDAGEAEFFRNEPDWRGVPDSQRGISALKATIKEGFWLHTKTSLPSLISEVETRIGRANARVVAHGEGRNTDRARLQYLHAIAKAFETYMQQACLGIYQNNCKEPHRVGETCEKHFFPAYGSEASEAGDRNLRATVRALNRTFASTMGKYGKTTVIMGEGDESDAEDSDDSGDGEDGEEATAGGGQGENEGNDGGGGAARDESRDGSEADGPSSKGSEAEVAETFPTQAILEQYYTPAVPDAVERGAFEIWVATQSVYWGGRGPSGAASETSYHGLFEHQSSKWGAISEQHLAAVWRFVDEFIQVALAAACPNEHVRLALRAHIVDPKLKLLKMTAACTLKNVLQCHARGNTGFYDGFLDAHHIRQQSATVSRGLRPVFQSLNMWLAENLVPLGGLNASDISRKVLDKFAGLVSQHLVVSLTAGLIRPDLLRGVEAASRLFDKLTERVAHGIETGDGAKTQRVLKMNLQHAASLILNVDMYYETSMMAFVGYVNALVVENGILNELPSAILTQAHIVEAEASLLEKIAGERPSDAMQREKDKGELAALKEALKTLNSYNDGYVG
ncbi:hypothetical protein CHGG_03129 [Chaetomium globosum CBS 148.51]|uniref:GED domain-containing protein n=1 Tax=Chaetomium globosum (strain ATCC 6205 / CBS 148.51 / DSM 1962 / NBRC 6347 / NRRL 1970) TaxID=306901 RepID=Q2H9H5_CHAGB|nr:uncharacterized protein CHGG_03129 [Chaetomium globosum CBS 148.51]EAQ91194.1 hypothetical protein CHGG_03129 [Chaetomium globosum CBS 148.51]